MPDNTPFWTASLKELVEVLRVLLIVELLTVWLIVLWLLVFIRVELPWMFVCEVKFLFGAFCLSVGWGLKATLEKRVDFPTKDKPVRFWELSSKDG